MSTNKKEDKEEHPLFPSGEWEGFYNYGSISSRKDKMDCSLNFSKGNITGFGYDIVGTYFWEGSYNLDSCTCQLTKSYVGQHQVMYKGHADENGIWGNWNMSGMTGGFHIWPKQTGETATAVEEKELEKERKLELHLD